MDTLNNVSVSPIEDPTTLATDYTGRCLAYAGDRFRAITGQSRPRPSTGNHPGEYWTNASQKTSGVIAPGVALYEHYTGSNTGHAACVERYDYATGGYFVSDANWDGAGGIRHMTLTANQIKTLCPGYHWLGTVY